MLTQTPPPEPDEPDSNVLVTRRWLVEMAGVTLVGTALFATTGCATGEARSAGDRFPHVAATPMLPQSVAGTTIGALNGGTKPVYVARSGSQDPVEHSVADTLFWGEQLMEHAMFFVMLMPGPELARPRSQAEQLRLRGTPRQAAKRASRPL